MHSPLRKLLCVLVASSFVPATAQEAPRRAGAPLRLEALPRGAVSIDGGPLRAQLDRAREFYLRIPNDDLLKGFRARARRPAPGTDLGGWYSADVFHVFGQILSGLARIHAVTGDAACREKVAALVRAWAACIEADGYFFHSRSPNAPHYIYDKMVGGLVDAYVECGVEEARAHLARITDWAEVHLDRSRRFNPGDGTEWYTLTENLVRAYFATGATRYREFGEVWAYTSFWDLFAGDADLFGPETGGRPYHAYSHVNTLGGAGALHRATGDPRYLRVLERAFETLGAEHVLATGGFGPDEELLPVAQLAERIASTHHSFETQCGSFAVLKLVHYLQTFRGEARYGDWAEAVLLNGLLAGLENADDGRVFYYSDYSGEGGTKFRHETPWTCCSGTRPMALADACRQLWLADETGLYANLFAPSTVRWEHVGGSVAIEERTEFPEEPALHFRFRMEESQTFALRIRTPAWLAGPITAALEGEPLELTPARDGWTAVQRTWRNDDRLTIALPFALRVVPMQRQHAFPKVLACGPVVLALRMPEGNPHALELERLEEQLVPSPGERLCFHLRSDPRVLVRPFHAFRENEPYFLGFDPRLAHRISHRRVEFHGAWSDAGRFRYGNAIGASAECTFQGTGVRWLGYRFDDAGRARVLIDGREVGIVDQYGPGRDLPFDWSREGLAPGEHRIRLELLESKAPSSRDRYLNVAGFEELGGGLKR